MSEAAPPPRLDARVPAGAARRDPSAVLEAFLGWVADTGVTPYPAQEEALLELAAGRHVVLSTPTGSGKSLVALGLHFKALCEGRRSFYTAPIKALVSEKFFALCEVFGPENVGMLTGDASINWAAPIVCCTAEVLSNMALRQGPRTDAPYVVMDEFHYYADRDRGVAWQVPLLALPDTTFLLMSATLGNTAPIEERLEAISGREVTHVHSDERPVPLDYEYCETPLHETVERLLDTGRAPVYVVSFTQREATEAAAALTSARILGRQGRERIAEALGGFRFDTPFGKEMRRLIRHGVGLHHAGLLPKYRLLVEQLAQQGLLRVISGTDTLGMGVNVPIRTVLFTKLAKYDGQKVRLLSVRDFRQIAGRAGRKGFDERGWVAAQAPEHVIENRRAEARFRASGPDAGRPGGRGGRGAGGKGKGRGGRGAKGPKRRGPPPGFVAWSRDTFDALLTRPPEPLQSAFRVSHGMLLAVLQREPELTGKRGGYGALAALVAASHETPARKRRLMREAAARFRSLRRGGIVEVVRHQVRVNEELQRDFSLHHPLSPYLVEALAVLDPDTPEYPLDVLAAVEAVLEDPVVILRAQSRRARDELFQQLKLEGVPYEERIARVEQVTHPRPLAELLEATFRVFAEHHPWVADLALRPKGIAREMVEGYLSFEGMIRRHGLQRSEGTLLRYLSQVLGTLHREVPDAAKTDPVHDVIAYLRELVRHTDSSLLEEWESLVRGPEDLRPAAESRPARALDLAMTPKAFQARVRAEMHALVRALAEGDAEEALRWIRDEPGEAPWDAARLEALLAPLREAQVPLRFDAEARRHHLTRIQPTAPRVWAVEHGLLDAEGDAVFALEGEVDLRGEADPEGPLLRLRGLRGA